MRNFPRVRQAAPVGECHRSIAVARYLERRAAAERAARQADERAGEESPRKRRRKPWAGRQVQTTVDVQHSPAAVRPEAPPVRQVPAARTHELAPGPARRNAFVRREHARMQPARPRPSRALAELVADAATP